MNDNTSLRKQWLTPAALAFAFLLCGGAASLQASEFTVKLSGDSEVPPVTTKATGVGALEVNAEKMVSGNVETTGVVGTMAHIHAARPGENGPVVIPLSKMKDNVWMVPRGTKLTDAQFKDFKAGNFYFNVHSEARPAGEIRGQIKPPAWMTDQDVRSTGGY